ncbi:hypothetical protein ACJRO7_006497 [Eucalyptus globulus]|uniref:MATH domain-containing protein n=1 Tax=Eucalyptus globulus TaxID=34317 RepID=A0ABD3II47_EUCGL
MPKRKTEATDSNAAEVGDEHDEITTEIREISPAHYVLKIESFSLLSKSGITMYKTKEFQVGDQKWRLILYPNGDKSMEGEDHVSLYLAVSGANPPKFGWEINATVRFFVFDQIRDEYLAKEGKNRRFHTMKSKWGIPRFMPLKTFINPSNGYLVDDTCFFGVEVFVVKNLGQGECLTLKASPNSVSHEWRISNFSTLVYDFSSEIFTAGKLKWKLHLYPRGNTHDRHKNLSIYLCLVDSSCRKVKVTFTIRLKGKAGRTHQMTGGSSWFSDGCRDWGFDSFLPLKTVQEYLVGDVCVVEAEVEVLGIVSKLP